MCTARPTALGHSAASSEGKSWVVKERVCRRLAARASRSGSSAIALAVLRQASAWCPFVLTYVEAIFGVYLVLKGLVWGG